MGVTLERVQFKFASIIGELCSEPKILSQFAVWLDMRLAEFKLKGSISLDCSGEPVPPEWMQGMGEVMAANAVHEVKSESAAPQSTDYVKHDDDIIIEDSQMSDSIHTAESFQSNCTRTTDMSRKRANIQWQEDQFKYTPKSARYLVDDTDTERNQSLMSIITETADSETSFQNPLSNDVSSFNMTDAGSTKDFQEGSKLSQYSYPTQSSDQSTSGTQLNSNISVYHQGHPLALNYRGGGNVDVVKHHAIIKWLSETFVVTPGKKMLSQTVYDKAQERFAVQKVLLGRLIQHVFSGVKNQATGGKSYYYNLGFAEKGPT